jgi:hypothetical protein
MDKGKWVRSEKWEVRSEELGVRSEEWWCGAQFI